MNITKTQKDYALAISSSCGSFTVTSVGVLADVTNLSVTITRTGRPVMICLVSDGTTNTCGQDVVPPNDSQLYGTVCIVKDSTEIARYGVGSSMAGSSGVSLSIRTPPVIQQFVDTSFEAGSKTYKIQSYKSASGGTFLLRYMKLVVYEL